MRKQCLQDLHLLRAIFQGAECLPECLKETLWDARSERFQQSGLLPLFLHRLHCLPHLGKKAFWHARCQQSLQPFPAPRVGHGTDSLPEMKEKALRHMLGQRIQSIVQYASPFSLSQFLVRDGQRDLEDLREKLLWHVGRKDANRAQSPLVCQILNCLPEGNEKTL